MNNFEKVFGKTKPVIGMVHLQPLPGAPGYGGSIEEIFVAACRDLEALTKGGATAILVENFGDIPYCTSNDLIAYTAFAAIAARLREKCSLPMGINVQFNNFEAEWAIAYSCKYDFIRVEVFAEHRMGPNGVCTPCGPHLMRMKERYPANIAILADVNVKHTFPVVDQPLDFTIESIAEGGADALICTGVTTGKSPSLEEVETMKRMACGMPVIVGSGVNDKTARDYLSVSDGAIVGSFFKKDGKVLNPIDCARVEKFMNGLK